MELNKNELWTFYIQVKWKVLANQVELTLSLITFKRDIRRVTYKKGKQPKYPIHKITIIECPTCGKMVEENSDHDYLPVKKIDLMIFTDISQWNTIHSES